MVIVRYITKELMTVFTGVTAVLLLIFLSNQFVRYLARAAAGQLPGSFVLKLMMLEIPHLLGLILPLSLFLAILFAFGRLYADNEMTVFSAAGVSRFRFVAMTFIIAILVAAVVAVLSLYLGPKVSADRDRLFSMGKSVSIIDTLVPGRFRTINHGRQVVYVEDISRNREQVKHVFVAQLDDKVAKPYWRVLTAAKGYVSMLDGEQYFLAKQGFRYAGEPGHRNYRVSEFDSFALKLRLPTTNFKRRIKSLSNKTLWAFKSRDPEYMAELQWRISVPIMVLVLALLAVPLSRLNPRQGRYAKVLPAMILLVIYANMMFVARTWLAEGKVSALLGMWWLHGVFIIFALILLSAEPVWRRLRRYLLAIKYGKRLTYADH